MRVVIVSRARTFRVPVLKHGINRVKLLITKWEWLFSMMMKKRKTVVYVTLISFLVVSAVYLVSPPQLKLFYVLDYLHLSRVDPQSIMDGPSLVCPLCGSILDRIVIGPDDPRMADEGWRCAYYCSHEDLFWVFYFPSGMALAQWYGPFNAYWKLTNAIAMLVFAICCVTIFLLAMRKSHSALMRNQ
jgi:hypothetical protein